MKKYYTCKYDRPFKEIMLKESNKEILEKLLESILNKKIEKIKVKNQELNVGNIKVKGKHVDAYLSIEKGKIEIEVNTYYKDYVHPRNFSYIANIYTTHTLIGKEYEETTDIIQINITYGTKEEKEIKEYKIRTKDGEEYIKNFYIYEINMEKIKEIWYHGSEKEKAKYIAMLDLEKEELEKISKKDKVAKKYMEELDRLNDDPEFVEYMSAEEDEKKIYNSCITQATKEGYELGLKEASLLKQKDIAKKLISLGVDIEIVKESTGLTNEQINNMK